MKILSLKVFVIEKIEFNLKTRSNEVRLVYVMIASDKYYKPSSPI